MIKGSVNSIETFGLVDGPGIRCVIFLNGCKLRCKFCHNPETWYMGKANMTSDEVVARVLRSKPYFRNRGGVTFSGGEPLLQKDFLLECLKKLKAEGIETAIDTAGHGNGGYEEILKYTDIVLLDIKHTNPDEYLELTGRTILEFEKFVHILNKSNAEVYIRQVIIPGYNDNLEYLYSLKKYLKKIKNIKKIEFLPYHNMAIDKYKKLNIPYKFKNIPNMDRNKCNDLYNIYMSINNNA